MDDPFIYILLIVALLVFSLLNSAFNSINQLQLELDKQNEHYHSRFLSFIHNNFLEFHLSLKIAYVITLIFFIVIIQLYLTNFLSTNIALLAISIVVIGIIIIPGLIIFPMTIGEYFASKIINYSSLFLVVLFILLSPITYTLILLSNAPLRFFLKDKFISGKKSDFNRDDLNELVRDSEKHTTQDVNDTEIKLFKNALEFSEIRLRDCMIPRTEIEAIELNDIHKDLQKTFIETGFSKIIIYKNTIDEIVGYIKSKSLLDKKDDLNHHIKAISIFPETMSANKLLRHFIRTGQNIAVIVDEFGGTSGIITIEDILEEIFGEIKDEHDTDDLYEKQLSETDYVFSGRLEIDYLNEKYTLDITESDEYETIAGYILYNTEKFPQVNDRILIDQFQFTILKVSNTKLDLIKLEIIKNHN